MKYFMTRPASGPPGMTSSTSWPLSRWSVAAGPPGGQRVVRDHDDRLLELAVEQLEQVEDLAGRGAVEVAGRLVGDEEIGVGDDRPGDRDALLLAAGELAGIVVLAPLEPDDPQRRRHVLTPAAAARGGSSSSGSSTFSNAVSTGIRL